MLFALGAVAPMSGSKELAVSGVLLDTRTRPAATTTVLRIRRYLLIATLLVCVVAGVYLGFAATAGPSATRVVALRGGDVAVFGKVQCIANIEGGRRQFLCSRRPRARAKYEVVVDAAGVAVYRIGQPDDPVYITP